MRRRVIGGWHRGRERLKELWQRVRPYAPFIAFVCGFCFDSYTLGRKVDPIDLYLVSFYGTMALAGLVLRELPLPTSAAHGANLLLQFCLGGSLSALVVLYFKSTGQPLSFFFVAALFVVAIVNEFLHRDEPPHRDWVLALWVVSATMLANFVVPHFIGNVSAVYFYVCALGAAGVAVALKLAFRFPWNGLRYAGPALAGVVLLWVIGVVPPVPLVLENNLVCTDYKKRGGDYTCRIDEPDFWDEIGLGSPTVTTDGVPVYALTAVFAPRDVDVVIEHRWYRLNDDGDWERTDTMDFRMTGGREGGWRVWSRRRKAKPGWWKVETGLKSGPVLGYEKFEVAGGEAEKRREAL